MDNGTTIIEQVIYEYPSLKAAYLELKFTSSTTTNSIHIAATNERSDPTANAMPQSENCRQMNRGAIWPYARLLLKRTNIMIR